MVNARLMEEKDQSRLKPASNRKARPPAKHVTRAPPSVGDAALHELEAPVVEEAPDEVALAVSEPRDRGHVGVPLREEPAVEARRERRDALARAAGQVGEFRVGR